MAAGGRGPHGAVVADDGREVRFAVTDVVTQEVHAEQPDVLGVVVVALHVGVAEVQAVVAEALQRSDGGRVAAGGGLTPHAHVGLAVLALGEAPADGGLEAQEPAPGDGAVGVDVGLGLVLALAAPLARLVDDVVACQRGQRSVVQVGADAHRLEEENLIEREASQQKRHPSVEQGGRQQGGEVEPGVLLLRGVVPQVAGARRLDGAGQVLRDGLGDRAHVLLLGGGHGGRSVWGLGCQHGEGQHGDRQDPLDCTHGCLHPGM